MKGLREWFWHVRLQHIQNWATWCSAPNMLDASRVTPSFLFFKPKLLELFPCLLFPFNLSENPVFSTFKICPCPDRCVPPTVFHSSPNQSAYPRVTARGPWTAKFFCQGPDGKCLTLQDTWPLLQIYTSAVGVQKQPQILHNKWAWPSFGVYQPCPLG